jgi:hypothetical protein
MSNGKIWAKVVNDEIMQLHDEDPTGLWHPDAIEQNDLPGYWTELPDYVHVGWKLKNDEWISGGQWMEEHAAENPTPPPGPPTAGISVIAQTETPETSAMTLKATAAGIANEEDWCHWVVDGKEYTTEEVEITIDKIEGSAQTFKAILTVTGPGGTHTHEETYTVREWAPPINVIVRN